jgi:hypothetical protein
MNSYGQRFSRAGRNTLVDATPVDRTPLDFATWHARIEGHNDGGAQAVNKNAIEARTA